ncbi:MAG: sulfotransferase family protein [Candidatus Binatia bacterium]
MKPIFIGGCERSGTTLLGAMLGAHTSCLCVPEMKFKFDILRFAHEDHDIHGMRGMIDKADIVRRLAKRSNFRIWELTLDVAAVPHEQISCCALIEWLVTIYGQKVGKPMPAMWVDHTPSNIRYARTLLSLFPEAYMVHIVRDGRAVAASVLPLDWGPNEIDSAARYWAERLAYGFVAESQWPQRVIRVRYEDLVEDPQSTVKKLCGALALNYEPAMSQGGGFLVPHYTAKQHALVGSTPDPARVNAWEQQFTPRQIEIFESVASDLLESLGYVPKFGLRARRMSRMEGLVSGIRELYKKELINKRRQKKRKRETIPA